jgi:bacterioferritin-associated ferredoxin
MYVCVCNAVTEGQLRNAVREGATTLERLRETLAVGTCCGCCTEYVEACFVRCEFSGEACVEAAEPSSRAA